MFSFEELVRAGLGLVEEAQDVDLKGALRDKPCPSCLFVRETLMGSLSSLEPLRGNLILLALG